MALDTDNKRFSAVNIGCPWRGVNYFPTGTIDAAERLAVAYLGSSIAAEPPVEVPDVVGETEAAGTATLEGDGFVVSVSTAYSPTVALGLIISQDPVGGSFAQSGSTVEIVVSLGPEPVVEQQPGGSKKKRKRLYVEIDGQSFDVDSYAEAEQLLQRAKRTMQATAEQAVERGAKRIKRGKRAVLIEKPVISTPFEELKPLVSEYQQDIEAIYRQIAIDAETRELLRLKLAEDDDEEAILVLLH